LGRFIPLWQRGWDALVGGVGVLFRVRRKFCSVILSLALALLAAVGGALATYDYDEGASLSTRLCSGACDGLAAFGLIGFILAAFLGLTPLAITIAAVAVAAPAALL